MYLLATCVAAASQPGEIPFSFTDEPLVRAVDRIVTRFGAHAVFVGDVNGRVTARFAARDLREALDAVVHAPYRYRIVTGGVIVERTPAALQPAADTAPLVLKPRVIEVQRAANLITGLFPGVRARADARSGSVIVFASPSRFTEIQAAFESLDTKGTTTRGVQAFHVQHADPARVATTLRRLFPGIHIESGPNRSLIVSGSGQELTDVGAVIAGVDAAAAPSTTPVASESVTVTEARPIDVARAVGAATGVRAAVSGQSVVLTGPPEAIARAKTLVAQMDIPSAGVRYSQVYRLHFIDAASVAALVRRTFRNVVVDVDPALNAFSAIATTAEQLRIADAVAQLDNGPSLAGANGHAVGVGASALSSPNGTVVEVVTLRAAAPGVPGTSNGASTTAVDIALAVNTALQTVMPDLRVTVPPNNPSQLILTGSPAAITLAKGLIAQLDVAQKLVVLDTQIFEVDETTSKDLGLSLGKNPVIATTYTETTPAPAANGVSPPLLGLQQLSRTALSFIAQLNLSLTRGHARILANPRITTISGRTATIRAGENISILTTNGGGTGVAATTQLQTFQTGVTLDITPVINAGNFITVALHPVVNSLAATTNGIPQISTRDTQTTVAMQEDQTLVIGGLIEDNDVRSESKVPFFGDLPLIGKLFRESTVDAQRNELIITVTPHIVNPGEPTYAPPGSTLGLPTPEPLPTLPPNTPFPARSTTAPRPRGRATPAPAPAPTASPGFAMPFGNPTPQPTPSAFGLTNTFTYGAPPVNNYAAPGDQVQIFYATFSPTVVRNNATVTVSAITSSNVVKVTVGSGGLVTQLASVGPGQWQATYNFSTAGLPTGQGPVPVTLTATRTDGAQTRISIPVSVSP